MEYVSAPTAVEADQAHRDDEAKIKFLVAEGIRQQKIREWHDLITPTFFGTRERLKRSLARTLRTWGETGAKIAYRAS